VGPLSVDDAPEFVRQLKARETVLPGRGLEDFGYSVPVQAHQEAGAAGPPKFEPAGGAWPRTADVEPPPAEGPPPHRPAPREPFAPGTSYAGEELDPLTRDVREDEEGEE
jgi:hypothetical protein